MNKDGQCHSNRKISDTAVVLNPCKVHAPHGQEFFFFRIIVKAVFAHSFKVLYADKV